MGKLSVLGAQRVKALSEILQEKLRVEIGNLDIPTFTDIEKQVDKEFGIDSLSKEFEETLAKARKLAKEMNKVTGANLSISESNYGRSNNSDYSKRKQELTMELRDKPISEIRAEYKHKEQMLWLCETLEEAKQLVGIGEM